MSRLHGSFTAIALAMLAAAVASPLRAQNAPTLAIDGGTLIDGNGGAPLQNSVIVITGNRITSVGRKGQVSYPPNTPVINAGGKFIIPGLIDSHGYGTWFINDMYINHGVTATVDNGLGRPRQKILPSQKVFVKVVIRLPGTLGTPLRNGLKL